MKFVVPAVPLYLSGYFYAPQETGGAFFCEQKMSLLAPKISTLLSVDLLVNVHKKPLAVALVENSKVPFYFNTHDPEKIRQGLRARAVDFDEKLLPGIGATH